VSTPAREAMPTLPPGARHAQAVIWRPTGTARTRFRIPYAKDNRAFIHGICGHRARPDWEREVGYWSVARTHFRPVLAKLNERFDTAICIDITVTRACGAWCRDALGDDCACACLGENHAGAGWSPDWIPVDDHWLIQHERMRRWFLTKRKEFPT
jgi:hypothetical protein